MTGSAVVTSDGNHADRRENPDLSRVLSLVADGTATSRAELARATGLARSTVSQRVENLIGRRLLVESGSGASGGGRPPQVLSLHPDAGVVLAADIGASHGRVAVADLSGHLLADAALDLDVRAGPDEVLGAAERELDDLLGRLGTPRARVRAIGIGLPGPVEFSTGTVVRPPIMPGWDGYHVPAFFEPRFDAAVLVDNDVNIMALGEQSMRRGDIECLLFIKVGTGIGAGTITHGRLHRGADGAAGDIGHIPLTTNQDTVCRCGNTGCVEAVASGSALVRDLRQEGLDVTTTRDVVRLALAGDPRAHAAVRAASHHIGEVTASLVSVFNPTLIVVGGALAQLEEELLAGIRSVVYRRALPLATRSVRIETSAAGRTVGVVGAVALARRHVLSAQGIAHLLGAGGVGA